MNDNIFYIECNYYIQIVKPECNIESSDTNIDEFRKSLRKEKRLKIA